MDASHCAHTHTIAQTPSPVADRNRITTMLAKICNMMCCSPFFGVQLVRFLHAVNYVVHGEGGWWHTALRMRVCVCRVQQPLRSRLSGSSIIRNADRNDAINASVEVQHFYSPCTVSNRGCGTKCENLCRARLTLGPAHWSYPLE